MSLSEQKLDSVKQTEYQLSISESSATAMETQGMHQRSGVACRMAPDHRWLSARGGEVELK